MTCTRRLEFDAAHRVPLHASKCRSLHGHRYAAEITCEAEALTPEGFVVDFGVVKAVVGGWIDAHLDHTTIFQRGDAFLEGVARLSGGEGGLRHFYPLTEPPTAENIAREILTTARVLLASRNLTVTRVRLYETPNGWADVE